MIDICYITFPSTYWALRAEKLLEKRGFPARLRPVPRSISSSCGLCLESEGSHLRELLMAIRELEIDCSGAFSHEGKELHIDQ